MDEGDASSVLRRERYSRDDRRFVPAAQVEGDQNVREHGLRSEPAAAGRTIPAKNSVNQPEAWPGGGHRHPRAGGPVRVEEALDLA
jgi:hypothetical protein